MDSPKIIIGLGNPDPKYQATFHNVGHILINYLADDCSFDNYKHFSYCKINNLILAKNNTYMNESGLAVTEIINFFDSSPQNITIIHDDADQALGKFKEVSTGGAGGHRGIESIIKAIDTQDFSRFKVGIRKIEHDQIVRQQAETFVLKSMSLDDKTLIYSSAGKFLTKKLKLNDN